MAYDFYDPTWAKVTNSHAALYDPSGQISGSYGVGAWIQAGMSPKKLVLGMPFYGYAWRLVDPNNHGLMAPASGPVGSDSRAMGYGQIQGFIAQNKATTVYNATIGSNYCYAGTTWIGYDGTQSISAKVSYAKGKGLLGYFAWHVAADSNGDLSKQAQDDVKDHRTKRHLLLAILLPTTAIAIVILVSTIWYLRKRLRRSKGRMDEEKESQSLFNTTMASMGNSNAPNLHVFSFTDIVAATRNFSFENKLGEGGYGPVYKGILWNEQEIAVKRLSKTSTQGFEEFKNEVMLTARLQHVNLVRVMGFCVEREEQMLIYEYMPNRSLDHYIYDVIRRSLLDWKKRVQIIEGVTQGLLYLQEYSRLTIIHRDLKASNILLDNEMKPKIADFGMARIFRKDESEANTGRIVGTYGYVPPEYVKRGIYSTKSDVYSFGVLLLQVISGKRNNCFYGLHENLNLLEYAYELWKDGRGLEFMDPSLDDADSSCKLMICMQIALLCVQEDPANRPSMLEVSSMLKNETTTMNTPKRPTFSVKRGEDEVKQSTTEHEIWSVADASITQMVPR